MKDHVVRRLYSIYPQHVDMLSRLSASLNVSQSALLRELIEAKFLTVFDPTNCPSIADAS
jgi:hypothetical protein